MESAPFLRFALAGTWLAAGLAAGTAAADSSVTKQRTVTQLAAGIYAIRHADSPDTNPQGNTTVIIGSRDVLVVDSAYLPSSAAEDIAQIRSWTDKPVRYLLNTHWHPDHTRGNSTYTAAFPGIAIIAHTETARLQAAYDGANRERYPKRVAALATRLEKGQNADGTRLTEAQKRETRDTLAAREKVLAEIRSSTLQLPTLTFDHELDLELGGRRVQIRHFGRGDTLGDAWAYLPGEKILISGDVLVHPVPYFFAGYPADLEATLRHLNTLEIASIVPGHGDVLHDKTYLSAVIGLLDAVIAQVNAEVVQQGSLSATLEVTREAIDTSSYRRQFAGDDAGSQEYFDESIAALIHDAFYQAPK